MTVGLLSIAFPAVIIPPSLMTINLIPDPNGSVSSAPAGFTTAMQAAATMIQNACPNTAITLNIVYGYDTAFGGTSVGAGATGLDLNSVGNIAYSTIRAAYVSKASTTAMNGVAANLPGGTTLGGVSSFQVPRAQRKALGLIGGVDATQDGVFVVGAGVPSENWVGVALHEMTHTMGREPGEAPFNFSRFTAAGTWFVGGGTGVSTYFSIDGGVTKLADYDTSSDTSDFLNGGVQDSGHTNSDSFDAFYISSPSPLTLQTLTTVDIQNLNAIGFQ
jgi:hypothetical protein